MPHLRRIKMQLARTICNSFITCLLLFAVSQAFSPPSSLQSVSIRETNPPLFRPSPVYYLDHDPVMERVLKRLEGITPIQTAAATKSKAGRKRGRPTKPKQKISIQDETWHMHYNSLLKFKQQYGHCLVPQHYPPDPKLGHWVMAQRRYYKLNQGLSKRHKKRYKLLEEAGFVFRVNRRGPRMAKLVSADNRSRKGLDEMDDFVQFMVENGGDFSEKEKKEAWKIRFSVYQKK